MRGFNVVPQICLRYIQRRVFFPIAPFSFEHSEKPLTRSVVTAVSYCTHGTKQRVSLQEILIVTAAELGAFNRSSQHLTFGGVYGATRRMDEDVDGAWDKAFARSAVTSS